MFSHSDDLVAIHAALEHHVDLDRRKPHRLCGSYAFQHHADRHAGIAHMAESGLAQAVQADSNTRQPGVMECPGFFAEQHAIGGQRNLYRFACRVVEFGEFLDHMLDAAPQQRFATGQADLLHTQPGEQSGQSLDLFEAEQLGARQEGIPLVEYFARHAVGAAQIAAVGD